MKTVKLEISTHNVVRKLAKVNRMSIKQVANLVLSNLEQNDIEMFRKREIPPIAISNINDDDEEYDEIEFEEDDEDDVEVEWEKEEGEEFELNSDLDEEDDDEKNSPSEIKILQLKLDAMKAGYVTAEEIDLFVKRKTG